MVVFSAGIKPRDELARAAGIEVGARGGVVVDDQLRTNDPNVYAIIALALGVMGFVLTLANSKIASAIALFAGILSAASLIGLLFDLKNKVKMPDMNALRNPESTTDFNTNLSLDFTPAFYIAVIAFLAASVFGWMRVNKGTT